VDLDTVADELYSLPPEEFTATRTSREKDAKAAGDPDLAKQIHQFTKPNAVGWLANQLVREHPDEIRPLIELGEDLRAATASRSGERLRELSRLQRQLISAIVEEAREIARIADRGVTAETARGLADTLRAALADVAAADELLAGRLTAALFRSGLEGSSGSGEAADSPTDEGAAAAGPAPRRSSPAATSRATGSKGGRSKAGGSTNRWEEADDRAVRQARHLVAAAAEAMAQAQSADDDAQQAVADADAEVERLEAELATARAARKVAESTHRRTRSELAEAERVHREAERRSADVSRK
jgi:hypothetical protein